jgi:hypothetical protein
MKLLPVNEAILHYLREIYKKQKEIIKMGALTNAAIATLDAAVQKVSAQVAELKANQNDPAEDQATADKINADAKALTDL